MEIQNLPYPSKKIRTDSRKSMQLLTNKKT